MDVNVSPSNNSVFTLLYFTFTVKLLYSFTEPE